MIFEDPKGHNILLSQQLTEAAYAWNIIVTSTTEENKYKKIAIYTNLIISRDLSDF